MFDLFFCETSELHIKISPLEVSPYQEVSPHQEDINMLNCQMPH